MTYVSFKQKLGAEGRWSQRVKDLSIQLKDLLFIGEKRDRASAAPLTLPYW